MCKNHGFQTHLPRGVSRRDLLKVTAASAGVVALGPMTNMLPVARGAPQTRKRLVIINLFGGYDSTNVFIPKDLTAYYDRRPTIAIQAGDAIDLNVGPAAVSDYVLHPALAAMGGMWADGDVAAVNKVGYERQNLSHFESMEIFSFGVRNGFEPLGVTPSGWIARYAERYAPTALGAVSVGVGKPLDFTGGASNPLLVQNLASFQVEAFGNDELHRVETAQKLLARYSGSGNTAETKNALDQAYQLADSIQAARASYTSPATYSNQRLSRQLKDIATLIQGGFETDIFFTGDGGHDTHGAQGGTTGRQANLMTNLDNALGSFAEDCKAMGVWDDMVVLINSEFGRRNFENGSEGTDHGHGHVEWCVGGAVSGGKYGPDLTDAEIADERWLGYDVDFRSINKEIVEQHLGHSASEIFPEPLEKDVGTLGVIA